MTTIGRLMGELRALFGEVTVRGALVGREALADMTAPDWRALVEAYGALAEVDVSERPALVAALPELVRRRLALVLLDRTFLGDVAAGFIGGAEPSE